MLRSLILARGSMRCISFAVAFFLLFLGQALAAAPTLDASGILTGSFNSASSGALSVSTTSTNDVVIFFIQVTKRTGAAPTVSSISGGSLTWAKRKAVTATYTGACFAANTCQGDFEEWWAFSSSALSTVSMTVTLSSSADEVALAAFGINGAGSSSAPFDTNIGLPASAQNLTNTLNTVQVTVNTTDNSDLIFGAWGSGASFVPPSTQTCSGWTQTGIRDSSGPTDYATLWAGAEGFTGAQSSLAITFFDTGCAANKPASAWTAIADAITNGVPSSGGSRTLLGVGQ
jgi:hypothetical protein